MLYRLGHSLQRWWGKKESTKFFGRHSTPHSWCITIYSYTMLSCGHRADTWTEKSSSFLQVSSSSLPHSSISGTQKKNTTTSGSSSSSSSMFVCCKKKRRAQGLLFFLFFLPSPGKRGSSVAQHAHITLRRLRLVDSKWKTPLWCQHVVSVWTNSWLSLMPPRIYSPSS